jgi:hypothetical protein
MGSKPATKHLSYGMAINLGKSSAETHKPPTIWQSLMTQHFAGLAVCQEWNRLAKYKIDKQRSNIMFIFNHLQLMKVISVFITSV